MTEAKILNTVVEYGDAVLSDMTVYLTMVFGYLATAYFVGKNLSRFQVIVVSSIFSAIAGLSVVTCVSLVHVWTELIKHSDVPVALKNVPFFNYYYWHYVTGIFLTAGLVVALYFMWNVRKKLGRKNFARSSFAYR